MRTFDMLLMAVMLVAGGLLLLQEKALRSRRLLVLAAVGLLMVHLFVEGARWQMFPAYLAALLLLLWGTRTKLANRAVKLALGAFVVILSLTSTGLSALVPIFRLPKPTGAFAVGTSIVDLTDSSRMEDADPASGAKRELVVQIWYPAQPSHQPVAPYFRWKESSFFNSYRSVVPTHARLNAPLADGPTAFPLVLLNSAWQGRRTDLTYLSEELASHGYVVAAIDHPYNSWCVALADGRVIGTRAPALFADDMTAEETLRVWEKELTKWTADTRFVLDRLSAENDDPRNPWFHRLDMKAVGAVGFSFGGGASVKASTEDSRIKAAVNLDGNFFSALDHRNSNQALMGMFEGEDGIAQEGPVEMELDKQDTARMHTSLQKYGGYVLILNGTSHIAFTDRPTMSPMIKLSHGDALAPAQVHQTVRQYVLRFFDEALKHQDSQLLHTPTSPSAAITFQRWDPQPPGNQP